MGGKRALAKAAGLSEAQLFRYLNGESDMAVSKLQAIAGAADVSAAWLLTGDGEAIILPTPDYEPPSLQAAIFRPMVENILTTLNEYQVRYSPSQRAHLIQIFFESLMRMPAKLQTSMVEKANIIGIMDYLGAETRDEILTQTENAIRFFSKPRDSFTTEQLNWLNRWDNMIQTAWKNYYAGYSGEAYFHRVSGTLPPVTLDRLTRLAQ